MEFSQFNAEQQQAANLKSHRVKFIATAGCGKSAVMAYKIKHDGYQNVRTISFTNAQINKLKNDTIESETTHRFCIDVLNSLDLPSFGIDSISALWEFLEQRPNLRIPKSFCDALYVDECQDSPRDFVKILNRLEGDVYVFGDPNQSIFLFNGSVGSDWNNDSGHWQTFYFHQCYRCTQDILNYAYLFMQQPYVIHGHAKPENCNPDNYMCLAFTNKQVEELRSFGLKATTVHKAKGEEWDVVYFYTENGDRWKFKGWTNYMKYVAITRAKYQVGFVNGKNGKRTLVSLDAVKDLHTLKGRAKTKAIERIFVSAVDRFTRSKYAKDYFNLVGRIQKYE